MKAKGTFKAITALMMVLLIAAAGCSKEEPTVDTPNPPGSNPDPSGDFDETDGGVNEDDLVTFTGEIGINIDAREHFKKGQPVEKVRVTPTNTSFFEEQVLTVDRLYNTAQLKFAVEDISDEMESALRAGIDLKFDLLDTSDSELYSQTIEKVLFKENGNNVGLSAISVEDLNDVVSLNPDIPYFFQFVGDDGSLTTDALDTQDGLAFSDPTEALLIPLIYGKYQVDTPTLKQNAQFLDADNSQQFYFQPHQGEENVYSIVSRESNKYIQSVTLGELPGAGDTEILISNVTRTNNVSSLGNEFKFRISKEGNQYKLLNYTTGHAHEFYQRLEENTVVVVTYDTFVTTFASAASFEGQNFRIVSTQIQYELEDIATWYGEPILPSVKNGFEVNTTLTNCTSETQSQTFQLSVTEQLTFSNSWEESVEVVSSFGGETSVAVEATAEVSFFGNGGSVTGRAEQSFNYSKSISEQNTISEGTSTTEQQEFTSSRTVNVPPGKQTQVYDAVQTYENITIPYVQEVKLTGTDPNGTIISGQELATQAFFGGITGTITEIGDTFIVMTLRGVAEFENAIEVESNAVESDASCN
ncbi:hypothetical protein [Flagellimonas sp.]|uniref:hypothetical protein n=1 Tax=Flagellimonas sp. TaxID=2058762 RepID=UPI003F49B816